jgi:hypothetical protein
MTPIKKLAAKKLPLAATPAGTDDHQPLTRAEVREILERAATLPRRQLSAVQVKLCQGIPGYTSPRPVRGKAAEKALTLNSMFVDAVGHNQAALPLLVEPICRLYAAS